MSRPTNELGSSTNSMMGMTTLPWGSWIDDSERATELLWPASVTTYDVMRSDSQVSALLSGMVLPISRYRWQIDPNGAPADLVKKLSEDINLPAIGSDFQARSRNADRFNFHRHLMLTLKTSLIWGHFYAEQVGEIDGDGYWRLKKLAPRMPKTIAEIKVERDGGLKSIKQALGPGSPEITVDRLAVWVWDQDPGSWVGRSFLRDMYRNWVIKDRLLRVDAVKHERNGMGVPVAAAPPNPTKSQMSTLKSLVTKFRGGDTSGAVVPYGADIELKGVTGTLPDTIRSIEYHDQAMARAALMMVIQLGQTQSGSRALGETFHDLLALGQDALAQWFAGVFNEHVIEDWVDWNYGSDTPAPLLVFERDEDPELAVADLKTLVDGKLITVDDELEAALRDKYHLPEKPEPEPEAVEPILQPMPAVPVQTLPQPMQAADVAIEQAPVAAARAFRRLPTEAEVKAAIDFGVMDDLYTNSINKLVVSLRNIRRQQAGEIKDQILSAQGDLDALAEMTVTPEGAAIMAREMERVYSESVAAARSEAEAQGVSVGKPNDKEALRAFEERANALEKVFAKQVAEIGSRQAIARTGNVFGGLTTEEVAKEVFDHIDDLSDSFIEKQVRGMVQSGINTGRAAVIEEGEPKEIHATELLDTNTCGPCRDNDGKVYDNLQEALNDYPVGGYLYCQGGELCRGAIFGVYESEVESTIQDRR